MLPETHVKQLDELAESYWWHAHRRETVVRLARAYLRIPAAGYLDLGCGTGASTRLIAEGLRQTGLLSGEAAGIDPDARMRAYCERHGVCWLGAAPGKTEGSFRAGFFTALDVLEHAERPVELLREFSAMLKPGATGIVSVPAFQALWSDWDLAAGHLRRYRAGELAAELAAAGFSVAWTGYLFSFAFPAAWALRRLGLQGKTAARNLEFPVIPAWLNAALKAAGRFERALLPAVRIPFGTSAVAVARAPA